MRHLPRVLHPRSIAISTDPPKCGDGDALRSGARLDAARVAWALAALAIAAFIFLQSSGAAPSVAGRTTNDILSYAAHLLLYSGLAFACARAAAVRSMPAVLLVVAIVTLYGATDELHQHYVPSREASLPDLAVDALGAAIGAVAGSRTSLFGRRRPQRSA